MAPNLPPSITVNRNLASTLRAFIKENGGKSVNETEMNAILQRVAKFDAERDSGKRDGGSIFDGGSTYLGGSSKDFQVKQGQQIQLSVEEFNEIFKGFINPLKTTDAVPAAGAAEVKPAEQEPTPEVASSTSEVASSTPVAAQETTPSVTENTNVQAEIKTEQSETDKLLRTVLGLADNEEIPEGITGTYVPIGGQKTFIIKQNGQTMDQAQLRKLASSLQEQRVEKFDNQMANNGAAEINDSAKLASAQFNVINNKYGDGKGNITADEYYNYEMRTMNEDELAQSGLTKEQFREVSDMNFTIIDADGDGEITKEELKNYIDNVNQNNDNLMTAYEIADYGEQTMMANMSPNIEKAVNDGYEVQEFEGSPIFVKDGKSFYMNMDGSVGDEIDAGAGIESLQAEMASEAPVTDQSPVYYNGSSETVEGQMTPKPPVTGPAEGENPEYDEAVSGQAAGRPAPPDGAPVRNNNNSKPLPGDIRSLSPAEQLDFQMTQLKAGKIQQTRIGNKLVCYEDGKYVTYDAGKVNRQEVSVNDLKKLAGQ